MKKYAFWNNKGGVGKTFLCYITAGEFARKNPDVQTIVIDMCPQANISEMLLGGNGIGSENLGKILSKETRLTIGGYFDKRLSQPDTKTGSESEYAIQAQTYAKELPSNLWLVAGDPSLELQIQSVNQLASVDLPEDRWKNVHSWLIDLQAGISDKFGHKVIFFLDCNPSFATYTAQALFASNRLIIPCTADGSSARAFDNIAQLIYGHNVPSKYKTANFYAKAKINNMGVPQIYLILFNRYTTNKNNPSSAFKAMYESIKQKSEGLRNSLPHVFVPNVEPYQYIPDAHTVSIVTSQKAILLHDLKPSFYELSTGSTRVNSEPLEDYRKALDRLMPFI